MGWDGMGFDDDDDDDDGVGVSGCFCRHPGDALCELVGYLGHNNVRLCRLGMTYIHCRIFLCYKGLSGS